MRERLYESALNDVRYYLGKPIPFIPNLAKRLDSNDPETRHKAWEEAARLA